MKQSKIKQAFSIGGFFHLKFPMMVAPMAGVTTPSFVAAACQAGVMGSIAGAYLKPEQIRHDIKTTKCMTSRPFAVNLFAPAPTISNLIVDKLAPLALQDTRSYRQELHISDPKISEPFTESFDKQFQVILEEKPAAFSFVFGLLDAPYIQECEKQGIFTIGAATCEEEAVALQALGVDAVVAQGYEAGGHRAIFSAEGPDPMIGTIDLIKRVTKEIKLPVIASGGLMNKEDVSRALNNGAAAVKLGTAFLLSKEAGLSVPYRKALTDDRRCTKTTRTFSGRLGRALENKFMQEMEQKNCTILPYPVQNAFTRDIRMVAAAKGNCELLSLWAGKGIETHRSEKWLFGSVESIVNRLLPPTAPAGNKK
jgi:nitronate monooxygenase